jgi:hypothetical protein
VPMVGKLMPFVVLPLVMAGFGTLVVAGPSIPRPMASAMAPVPTYLSKDLSKCVLQCSTSGGSLELSSLVPKGMVPEGNERLPWDYVVLVTTKEACLEKARTAT